MFNRAVLLKKIIPGLMIALILAVSFTFLASAQGSESFALGWGVLSSGGGQHTSDNYIIEDTLGLAAVGNSETTTSQGPVELVGGFFGPTKSAYSIFLPGVKR